MLEYLLLGVSFISLYLAILWISILYLEKGEMKIKRLPKFFPLVSIIIPAHNEEKTIKKTITSLLNLNYPKNKLEIIVVNDGSTDKTADIVKQFFKKHVKLINKKQGGKATALNKSIKYAKGEIIGVVDADSTVEKESLISMLYHFENKKVGAVISGIKVENKKHLLEKLQHFEYIFATFLRRLLTAINTLYLTPGVLSLYKKEVLDKVGEFDEHNPTEDLEMALRLHHEHYRVILELNSITHTVVPSTLSAYKRQRVRWCRGHIHNVLRRYRDMFFKREYGFMGTFQFPLHIISPMILILVLMMVVYSTYNKIINFLWKVLIVEGNLKELIIIPTFKEFVFSLNIKIIFPLALILLVGLYMYNKAHKYVGEHWGYPLTFILFLTIYPPMLGFFWIISICEEILRIKTKW